VSAVSWRVDACSAASTTSSRGVDGFVAPPVLASSFFPPLGDQWGRQLLPLTGLAHPTRMPKAGVWRGQEAPLEQGIGFPTGVSYSAPDACTIPSRLKRHLRGPRKSCQIIVTWLLFYFFLSVVFNLKYFSYLDIFFKHKKFKIDFLHMNKIEIWTFFNLNKFRMWRKFKFEKIRIWTKFEFEQFSKFEHFMSLNSFWIWTIFDFEQFLNLNKLRIWQKSSLNKIHMWTKIEFEQILYMNKIWIWTNFESEHSSKI
jgi:hypothetical protein